MERIRKVLAATAVTVLAVAAAACGGRSGERAVRLFDGSSPPAPPAVLQRLGKRFVVDRVRAVPPEAIDARMLRACFADFRGELRPRNVSLVVERIGVSGRSLTFHGLRNLYGCDASAGRAYRGDPPRTWCGEGFWWYPRAGPIDPRLDLGCSDRNRKVVGFAWFEPLERARWLTVQEPGYTEVYEVAAALPVRLITHDVPVNGSSAFFRIRQYAADGRELEHETFTARVAG